MKRPCHRMTTPTWGGRQLAVTALLHQAKLVNDPSKLEYLNAQVAKCKAGTEASSGARDRNRRHRPACSPPRLVPANPPL
jgi:hypothetical protein